MRATRARAPCRAVVNALLLLALLARRWICSVPDCESLSLYCGCSTVLLAAGRVCLFDRRRWLCSSYGSELAHAFLVPRGLERL